MTHTPTSRTSSRDCPRTRPAALTSYCRTAGNPPTPDHQPLWTCVCRTLTDTFAEAKDDLTQQHLFDGALPRHAQTEIGFNGQSPAFLFFAVLVELGDGLMLGLQGTDPLARGFSLERQIRIGNPKTFGAPDQALGGNRDASQFRLLGEQAQIG